MPRTARASVGGVCYHAINRGNGGMRVFHHHGDYAALEGLLGDACQRLPMRLLAYCLMPNHFHFVLWPRGDGDLSRWMQWLLTSHVRRYHRLRGTSGHVWQGRFKAFPIQQDEHLLTVLHYVERNPLRAGLVKRAEDWRWSSLRRRQDPRSANDGLSLAHWPVDRPSNWLMRVNRVETDAELEAVRLSIQRGRPLGSPTWAKRTATRLGLESSLQPLGRPKKQEGKTEK